MQTFTVRFRIALTRASFLTLVPLPAVGASLADDPKAVRLEMSDPRIAVHGLAWYVEDRPAVTRLPVRLKATFPPKVWSLAQAPAGVRLRFSSDSHRIGFSAQGDTRPPPSHVPGMGNSGVDVYHDGIYLGSAGPDAKGKVAKEWYAGQERKLREYTIYLPYNRRPEAMQIMLEPGAKIAPPRPFAVSKPVVFYGSSITQGSAASNPGLTLLALIGRWLNVDFVNLGFSGNGMGEPELARAVAEIDAACFVVDYWANPPAEVYRATLPNFVAILRAKHPRTPIIVTSPYYNPSEESPGEAGERQIEKRAFAREFVAKARAGGDRLITLVDGLDMISREQADGLADGRHANSMGFFLCARSLEPPLRAALGLPPGPRR